jgi:hypothetical protein
VVWAGFGLGLFVGVRLDVMLAYAVILSAAMLWIHVFV